MNRVILVGLHDQKYLQLRTLVEEALTHLNRGLVIEEHNDIDHILSYRVAEIPAIVFRENVLLEGGELPSIEELEDKLLTRMRHTENGIPPVPS